MVAQSPGRKVCLNNNQTNFLSFASRKQNFNRLNSFQTQLEEPPKHVLPQINDKQPLFPRAITPILEDKKQTDDQNQNILQKILLKSMLFCPKPRSDECHLSTLSYSSMNSIVPSTNQVLLLLEQLTPWTWDRLKLLQSPNFSALCLHAINPTTPIHGLMKGPRWRPAGKLNERHLRSHGKTGDCEKSNEANENVIVECKDNLQSQKSIDVASRG